MVSLDIRKPTDVMSSSLSQIRVLSIWDVQLARRILKDCSVIFLSQNYCFRQISLGDGEELKMSFHLSNKLFRVQSRTSVCNPSSTWARIMA